MTTPSASLTESDYGIGAANYQGVIVAVVGCSSTGTPEVPSGPTTDGQAIKDAFGVGAGPELACYLTEAGLAVTFCKADSTTPGTAGAVTPTRASTPASDGVVTVSGAPYDAYEAAVEILEDAVSTAVQTGSFRYTLDGGDSYLGPVALPCGLVCTAVVAAGTTPPTITVSGTPDAVRRFQLNITTSGANGTAAFKVSIDGGSTWLATGVTVPTTPFTYAVGTTGITVTFANSVSYSDTNVYTWHTASRYVVPDSGITLQFENGVAALSFAVGDSFAFTCVAPAFDSGALEDAMDALHADPQRWKILAVAGEASTAAAAAAIATMMEGKALEYHSDHRATYMIMGCPAVSDANLRSGFATYTGTHVNICAGHENLRSALSKGRYFKRSSAWVVAKREALDPPNRCPGRVHSGPLPDIAAVPGGAPTSGIYRDERVTPGLDALGFTTLTTRNVKGYFITQGQIMAPVGSDYSITPMRKVMNVADEALWPALELWLNEDLRTNEDGTLYGPEAERVEEALTAELENAVLNTNPPYVSGCKVALDRTVNVQTQRKLVAKFKLLGKGYIKTVDGEVSWAAKL